MMLLTVALLFITLLTIVILLYESANRTEEEILKRINERPIRNGKYEYHLVFGKGVFIVVRDNVHTIIAEYIAECIRTYGTPRALYTPEGEMLSFQKALILLQQGVPLRNEHGDWVDPRPHHTIK